MKPTENNRSPNGNVNLALEMDEDKSAPPYTSTNLKENSDKKLADNEFEELPYEPNFIVEKFEKFWSKILQSVETKKNIFKILSLAITAILYNCYFIGAIVYYVQYKSLDEDLGWCTGLGLLILLTVTVYFGLIYGYLFKGFFLKTKAGNVFIRAICRPIKKYCNVVMSLRYFAVTAYFIVFLIYVIFVVVDSANDRRKLISAFGLVIFILLGAIFSKHPSRIDWRQVFWGVGLQFIFGLIILRWPIGREIFECLGHKVETFLDYTEAGSGFVFGYLGSSSKPAFNPRFFENRTSITFEVISAINESHGLNTIFIFKSLSTIYFFSFMISMLFYLGTMQWVIGKVGWVLQVTLGSTACESMIAAGNVFLGLAEAPLIIRPYIKKLTPSELHAVMTSGFSTIAGGILAALIAVNVSATHLLSASLMSAPAALACSKLLYPETKKSKTSAKDLEPIKSTEYNLLDAASQGAGSAVALVTNIAANLIAIISFIAFINGVLQWFGSLVGAHYLTFEFILGKIFIPVSWLMGVENDDLETVGQLLGIKTFVNTLVAYLKFPMVEHTMSARSKMIATYALCGFSNPASIGITIASLSAMAPERRPDIAKIALRAFVAGGMASCLTACVAGTLVSTD